MKKHITFILLLFPFSLFSDLSFSFGTTVNNDIDKLEQFNVPHIVTPSLFWEISNDKIGIGMTYVVNLIKAETRHEKKENDWFLKWEALIDFKYHFLGTNNFIDPYTEISMGLKLNNLITSYERASDSWILGDDGNYYYDSKRSGKINKHSLQSVNIISYASAGANLNFKNSFIGAKVSLALSDSNIYNISLNYIEFIRNYRISFLAGYRF